MYTCEVLIKLHIKESTAYNVVRDQLIFLNDLDPVSHTFILQMSVKPVLMGIYEEFFVLLGF
jgi:hypothetical protein